MIFKQIFSSCYVLLTDQIALPGCLYFLRYWMKLTYMDEVFIRTSKENIGYSRKGGNEIFTSNVERLDDNEKTLLKQEVESLKTSADF